MLNGTKAEVRERHALRVNPAKTCQPIGAMYAALGIHNCMPHSHGSQGCCAYHRSQLTRHYKEPVVATTSSFTEGASVFGGVANLQTALMNIFAVYNPDIVAVHTTCLSEVIGDDIPMIIEKSRQEGKIPEGKIVIHANTPSFVGSHVTGFSNMTKAMVSYLSEHTGKSNGCINILPGWVEPSDMREIKSILEQMDVKYIMFPDTSNVLDTPHTGDYKMYPDGGVTIEQLKSAGDSYATIACGEACSIDAAEKVEKKCGVPFEASPIPIGLTMTDKFIDTIRKIASVPVPETIENERGRLLDMMIDMSQYFHGLKVAIFGDPDSVLSMTQFAIDLGMKPKYVITGTPGKSWEQAVLEIIGDKVEDPIVRADSDIHFLHQNIKVSPVDLLIGNTYGKYVSRAEGGIPFVRFGFPILDRVGHRAFPSVGYKGAMRLIEKITDALFDHKDRTCPEELFELVM